MKIGIRTRRSFAGAAASLATLCLPADATAADAKRAYRDLLRQLHPDAVGGEEAGQQLATVVAAYRELERSGWLDANSVSRPRSNGGLLDIRA